MNEMVCHGENCVRMGYELAQGAWLWDLNRMAVGMVIAVAIVALAAVAYGGITLFEELKWRMICWKNKKEETK